MSQECSRGETVFLCPGPAGLFAPVSPGAWDCSSGDLSFRILPCAALISRPCQGFKREISQ